MGQDSDENAALNGFVQRILHGNVQFEHLEHELVQGGYGAEFVQRLIDRVVAEFPEHYRAQRWLDTHGDSVARPEMDEVLDLYNRMRQRLPADSRVLALMRELMGILEEGDGPYA